MRMTESRIEYGVGKGEWKGRRDREGLQMMQKRDIEGLKERMKRFGLAIIRLAEKFPAGRAAGIVASQMIRSGTSAGANYRAACRARSRADFVAKMGITEEELDETLYWLEVSLSAGFVAATGVNDLLREGNELLAIVVASIRTAKRKS
jgi:four helix bundle protein